MPTSAMVERVLQLIGAMARAGTSVGVSQLGHEFAINRSAAHRPLESLVRHGYDRQKKEGVRYGFPSHGELDPPRSYEPEPRHGARG